MMSLPYNLEAIKKDMIRMIFEPDDVLARKTIRNFIKEHLQYDGSYQVDISEPLVSPFVVDLILDNGTMWKMTIEKMSLTLEEMELE